MDCHYSDSWSVHRWNVCKSWLVLMYHLNRVVFGILHIYRVVSARAVGQAWTIDSQTDNPSNRFHASLATRMFLLPLIKKYVYFGSRQSCHCWWFIILHPPSSYWTNVKSLPTIFIQGGHFTTFDTFTTFVRASWQSYGWLWWPVAPLCVHSYCGSISSLIPMRLARCRVSNHC